MMMIFVLICNFFPRSLYSYFTINSSSIRNKTYDRIFFCHRSDGVSKRWKNASGIFDCSTLLKSVNVENMKLFLIECLVFSEDIQRIN